jgi:hypothetical protein
VSSSVGLAVAVVSCSPSGSASIAFGTGGTDCDLDRVGSTFSAGTTVRMVAEISPLPSTVTVTTTRDGEPLVEPTTVEPDGSIPCVYGSLPGLEPGHYRIVVSIPGSQVPPLSAEFDVTPAP